MALKPIELATPSTINRLSRCPHEEALHRHATRPPGGGTRANSTAIALGNAAHALVAVALAPDSESVDLGSAWERAIVAELGACSDSRPPTTWWRYNVVRRGAIRIAAELRAEVDRPGCEAKVETEVRVPGYQLWGRPDLVIVSPTGTEIVDLKTGASADGEPHESEVRQLLIYAHLVELDGGAPVRRVRILRVDGPPWSKTLHDGEARSVVAEGSRLIAEFNDAIDSTEQVARPGDQCDRCDHALTCEVAWRSMPFSAAASGEVVSTAVDRSVGSCQLKADEGTVSHLAGVPAEQLPDVGAWVRVIGLQVVGDGSFRWRPDRSRLSTMPTQI